MKTATASFQFRSAARCASAFAVLTTALLCVLLPACKKSNTVTATGGGVTVNNCAPNVGNTSGNAVAITSGQSYEGKLCYEGVPNWFMISVPAGSTLLDVSAAYPAKTVTPVNLEVKVFWQSAPTTLTQLEDFTASGQSDAGVSAVRTTVLALQPGAYYVEVADSHGTSFDSKNAYAFALTYATDPDLHEPNDSPDAAKPTDSNPGYLAYFGDLDVFTTTVADKSDLLTLTITNPVTALASVNYEITTSSGGLPVASGVASPSATPLNSVLPITSPGAYYLTLSYPSGASPDRTSAHGYSVSFGSIPNPDTVDNHTIGAAVCPGGGAGPCTPVFGGTAVTLPSVSSYIAAQGQHDFYRVDVTSGAPAVLEMGLTSSSASTVKYAVDLLTPDPNSACQFDSDCNAIDAPCSSANDCELSHACLAAAKYGFCPSSTVACRLCEGAGICIPASGTSGPGVCAVSQYLSAYIPSGSFVGATSVSSAQPLFTAGAYYVDVHDALSTNVDEKNPYTLTLKMVPEPDPNDQSPTAAKRNNFYNPYPTAATDLSPNTSRAIDITAQVQKAQPVTGYISYQADEDWFSFQHPCPGADCGLDFQWTQPGPSNVEVAFFMLNQDLSVHESFAYTGSTPTTSLTGPATGNFANADCTSCSFASKTATATGSTPYLYYLRIADIGQKHWDYNSTGQYSFTVTSITNGCPSACSNSPSGTCECFCTSTQSCPAPVE